MIKPSNVMSVTTQTKLRMLDLIQSIPLLLSITVGSDIRHFMTIDIT